MIKRAALLPSTFAGDSMGAGNVRTGGGGGRRGGALFALGASALLLLNSSLRLTGGGGGAGLVLRPLVGAGRVLIGVLAPDYFDRASFNRLNSALRRAMPSSASNERLFDDEVTGGR